MSLVVKKDCLKGRTLQALKSTMCFFNMSSTCPGLGSMYQNNKLLGILADSGRR